MKVLGIETALGETEVALLDDRKGERPRTLLDPNLYSESVVTLAQELLAASGIALKDLDGIAVSLGPGSFTGLRIGLSVAKGFAFSADLPLVAVSTLDALATSVVLSNQIEEGSDFIVLLDAKRNEYYYARYRSQKGSALQLTAPRVVEASQFFPQLADGSGTIVVTTEKTKLEQQLREKFDTVSIRIIEKGKFITPAGAVALLALQKLIKGDVSDLISLEPSYLKDFIIQGYH